MQFTLYIIPLLITIGLALTLALYAWQQRHAPSSLAFIGMCVAIVIWSAFYTLEVTFKDLDAKLFWGRFTFTGIALLPVAWFVFSLHFTGRSRWLTRRRILLLLIVPGATVLVAWTNFAHGLMLNNSHLEVVDSLVVESSDYGTWFWIHAVYSYSLLAAGSAMLIGRVWQARAVYRWQALFIVIGAIIPWIANIIRVFELLPLPVDFTSVSFSVALVAFGWSIFRFQLFKLIPVAHEKIFERMPDSVVVLDVHNRVVDLNPAAERLLSVKAEVLIGQDIAQVFASQRDFVEKCLSIGDGQAEIKFEGLDGAFRWFDVQMAPLYGRRGVLEGRLSILRDITGRKQSELAVALARDEALRANQFKTQLVSKVSHDLRTPLNAIGGYAELLTMEAYGHLSQAQVTAIQRIQESTKYLNKLIAELLDQAQLAAGKLTLNREPFVLCDLAENTAASVRILAEMKGLDFYIEVDPSMPEILVGDADRLRQILLNLIGNAIKFTTKGLVHVRLCRVDAARWAMEVTDSGAGIPADAQMTIFEPFQQTEKTRTSHEGYGLGLAIVKELTTMMEGEIRVMSELNQGSTFTVMLPLMPYPEIAA
jgi:PAS domain S-box-containing protein